MNANPLVPWVALWSAEQASLRPMQHGGRRLLGTGVQAYGVTWLDYPNLQGQGQPLFGQVHTLRQFRAMRGPRCQVCGALFPRGEPVPWVLVGDVARNADGVVWTQTPPVCRDCLVVARRHCPHLSAHPELEAVLVRRFEPVAVNGDVWPTRDRSQALRNLVVPIPATLPEGSEERRVAEEVLPYTMGRQLVVALLEYEPLEVSA